MTSRRVTPLPTTAEYQALRLQVLTEEPNCTLRTHCAGAPSTEVDHIGHRDDHTRANLRGVCTRCHHHRSSSQGGTARAAKYQRRRPPEAHPGIR